jgi:pimeloyl-ACP methyl ester carboxylesterase
VETTDHYELTVMHIKGAAKGPVVFMQHGLFSSAETWVTNADQSPAFILARAGFDVWMGNNRGSMYGRKNSRINPDKDPKDFFNYSFYELGEYDAPA